jgi:hypothetical protein
MLADIIYTGNAGLVSMLLAMILSWLLYRWLKRPLIVSVISSAFVILVARIFYPYFSIHFYCYFDEMFDFRHEGIIIFITQFIAPVILFLGMLKLLRLLKTEEKAKQKWLIVPIVLTLFIIFCYPPQYIGGIRANEVSARSMLSIFISAEKVWQSQDYDKNGKPDFWTYDISCFNRMYQADGTTKINLIDIALAKADTARAKDDIFGAGLIEIWDNRNAVTTTARCGYYFRAMLTDENGQSYNQNKLGKKKIKAANSSKFAFVAYPVAYGITGIKMFIVNESGIVYGTDFGGGVREIDLHWPGKDPTKVKGPTEKYWSVE